LKSLLRIDLHVNRKLHIKLAIPYISKFKFYLYLIYLINQ
jgi:hypothetical protein